MPNDLTTALSNFLGTLMGGQASMPVGSGTATASVSGVLSVNTTQAGTAADTNETDLWSYTLPASTLNVNGKCVRVTAWGDFAANANNKTVRPYFAGSNLGGATTAASGVGWRVVYEVIRTGAAAQITTKELVYGGVAASVSAGTASGDTTAGIVIKVTGQNGTASANDIVFRGAIVEVLN